MRLNASEGIKHQLMNKTLDKVNHCCVDTVCQWTSCHS